MSRKVAPRAWWELVLAGHHYGRESGLATTTASGQSPERAVVTRANEIAGRLIEGGFHI